jgi:monofunctional biosynthetic peptidoglycan transglycosylase
MPRSMLLEHLEMARRNVMRLASRDFATRIESQARPRASSVDQGVIREHPFSKRTALTFRQAANWAKTRLPAVYRRARLVVRALAVGCAILLILPYLLTPLYLVANPVSTLMLWRWAKGARVERVVKPIDLTAPTLSRTVLAAEDERFCSHHGIDFAELRQVIKAEASGIRRSQRGGSSITQQLAKNLFLWPGHSYVRKALEFPLALWIDLVIPKWRQLEIYLNIAEWGPNGEFGAEAGARRAFGKSAGALSVSEAALLAAALPNPVRRDARRPGEGLRRLAATYVGRAAAATDIDRCLRTAR